ncbi:hypothetical protein K504DRAFT_491349 [Pleomassaria siparia CBS 279.74]|uniref:Uncharacterized protein n=1 Tax=Pleomassaria siparia CBS 279.74 TaxID=1314801 RepID=A0A6G1K806_9PLEO|nr:hypothetical protein K504DRAFT_491349 [Pleomassaria siparia CBS 279.74]
MPLSRLEQLPAELLEPIYLLSNNVNLALSSPVIGAKLSSEKSFRSMSMRILFHQEDKESTLPLDRFANLFHAQWAEIDVLASQTFSVWPPRNKLLRHRAVTEKHKEATKRVQVLQSQLEMLDSPHYKILNAKFMTWARFKSYMLLAMIHSDEPNQSRRRQRLDNLLKTALYSNEQMTDRRRYHQSPHFNVDWRLCMALQYLPLRSAFPCKFLQSPFDEDKATFLQFLLRFRCQILPQQEVRVHLKCLALEALNQPSEIMLACLFSEQFKLGIDCELLHDALRTKDISTRHLRLIVKAEQSCIPRISNKKMMQATREVYSLLTALECNWGDAEVLRVSSDTAPDSVERLIVANGREMEDGLPPQFCGTHEVAIPISWFPTPRVATTTKMSHPGEGIKAKALVARVKGYLHTTTRSSIAIGPWCQGVVVTEHVRIEQRTEIAFMQPLELYIMAVC